MCVENTTSGVCAGPLRINVEALTRGSGFHGLLNRHPFHGKATGRKKLRQELAQPRTRCR